MTERFQYASLCDNSKNIRVLEILPGERDSIIECTMTEHKLVKNGHACLSYRWGTEEAAHTILLNARIFRVRSNLYNFLHGARRLKYSKPIWIDAISINQSDNDEKTSQVRMMGEIYSLASETTLWLDVSTATIERVCDVRDRMDALMDDYLPCEHQKEVYSHWNSTRALLQKLRDVIANTKIREVHDHPHDDCVWALSQSLACLAKAAVDLRSLVDDLYWTRAWILQEITLSSRAVFFPTGRALDLSQLKNLLKLHNACCKFARLYQKKKRISMSIHGGIQWVTAPMIDSRLLQAHARFPRIGDRHCLDEVLLYMPQKGCADPRDRIFSIQSMLQYRYRVPIDYLVSKETLWYQCFVASVQAMTLAWDLKAVARDLFASLEIPVPPMDEISSLRDMLDANPASLPLERLMWATPEAVDIYSNTELKSGKLTVVIGMYIVAMSNPGEYIMFEFPLEHCGSLSKPEWVMRSGTDFRTWMLIRGEWVNYRSDELNDYAWPASLDESTAGTGKYSEQMALDIERQVTLKVKGQLPPIEQAPARSINNDDTTLLPQRWRTLPSFTKRK